MAVRTARESTGVIRCFCLCPREGRCLSASAEEAQAPCADCSLEGGLEAETVDAETMAEAIESDTEFEDCRTVVRIHDNRITEIRHYAEVSVPDMMADVLALNVEK